MVEFLKNTNLDVNIMLEIFYDVAWFDMGKIYNYWSV